jgi:enoyl-CoA hydratase/carnithine racemase
MPATLTIEDVAPGVRSLTLSNPARRNALDGAFLDALELALRTADPVRAWLVRSDDAGVFSSGYDLNALSGFPEGTPLPDTRLGLVLDLLEQHPAPSIAVVRGPAIGAGCELAVACDFRVGDATARLSLPPAKLGVVYALAGLRRVARVVGPQVAKRLFLAADSLDAAEAHRVGLLDASVVDAEVSALTWALRLAGLAPLAVKGMKKGFSLLDEATAEQRAAYELIRRESFNSADAREGIEALREKREPQFTGR